MFIRVLGLTALAVFASTAQAVSFDCRKASNFVENEICKDPELSRLDDDLDLAYQSAIDGKSKSATAALKKQQMKWLSQRDACQTNSCVKKSYQKRLIDLEP